MRRFVILIGLWNSLLLWNSLPAWAQTSYPLLLAGGEQASWNFTLERGSLTMTGICITRQTERGLVGTVINEFGLHFFDFTCQDNRVKVSNVFPAMNKWYIRRVLRSDLRLLSASKALTARRRDLQVCLPDSLSLQDKKFGITYRFERMK